MKISGVILTHNNESQIANCIKSLKFCDEILVVDDNSTDDTNSISKKLNCKVIKRSLNDDFAGQRNFALSNVQNDWVFFLDSDEVVSTQLTKSIENIKDKDTSGFLIKRQAYILGKYINHGEFGSKYIVRLVNKNSGKWVRKVHEYWLPEGKIKHLDGEIIHYPAPTLSVLIDKINRYSKTHMTENQKEGKSVNYMKALLYPKLKFINDYIIKRSYADKTHGFVLSILMSFHSFLTWGSLWLNKRSSN